jgi:O-antigen ligase
VSPRPATEPTTTPVPVVVPKQWRPRRDVVAWLTLFAVLTACIPSRLIFSPLGGAGTPAALVGLFALAWWVYGRLVPGSGLARGYQPIRIAIGIYLGAAFLSYAAGLATRYVVLDELNNADRTLIALLAFVGIVLLGADGIDRRDRLETLLRRIVVIAAIVAAFGVLQFFTDFDVAELIKIPGMTENLGLADETRANFRRIAVTATHPIELGVFLAMAWPLAIHFALRAAPGPASRRGWAYAAVISLALAMSLSRSAVLGVVGAAIVIAIPWSWRRRLDALAIATVFAIATRIMIPGLIGTLRGLFVSIGSDSSVAAREARYPLAFSFIHERPILGRGFGTLVQDRNRLVPMDNQLLKSTIEMGLVGLIALLLLFVIALAASRGTYRRADVPPTRELALALAASVLAGALSFYTFDALAYPMVTGMLALVLGSVGALWRLVRQDVDVGR